MDCDASTIPEIEERSAKRRRLEAGHDPSDNHLAGQDVFQHNSVEGHGRAHFGHIYAENYYAAPPAATECHAGISSLEIMEALKFEQMDVRQDTIAKAHASTCRWIFERLEYQDWRNVDKMKEHRGFLWIKSKPGAGKSTLMKFVLKSAGQQFQGDTVASFFFNARGSTLERSVEGMYRSLLHQLLSAKPRLQRTLRARGTRNPDWSVHALQDIFEEVVLALTEDEHITCIVDALDECDAADIRAMVEFFEELGNVAVARDIQFRVCFSSRHYPHVELAHCQELILEGQEGHQQDISDYIKSKLRIGTTKLATEIKSEVLQRAQGVFLWVVLVVGILTKETDRGNNHQLRRRLKEIPDGLHELFDDILRRGVSDNDYLVPVLQWILFARRPLSREELYFAVQGAGYGIDGPAPWNRDELDSEAMHRFLLHHSKGLIELTKGKNATVQFIHESVRDYLRDTGFKNLAHELCENLAGLTHDYLKQCCQYYVSEHTVKLLYLPEDLPKAKYQESKNLRNRATELFPFLDYAVSSLVYHAECACSNSVPQASFLASFPLSVVRTLSNLLAAHEIRRYSPSVNTAYILTEGNAPYLLDIELARDDPSMHPRSKLFRLQERHRTLLGAAIHGRSTQVVSTILKYGGSTTYAGNRLEFLGTALDGGRIDIANLLLNEGVLAAEKTASAGFLVDCSSKGKCDAVRFLLNNGADVDGKEFPKASTALYAACESGHEEVVKMLVDNGANVNARIENKAEYSLQAASFKGHATIVEMLLNNGAHVNAQGGTYSNALQAASLKGHATIVEILLNNGAHVNAQGGPYGNALQAACAMGNEKAVEILIGRGAHVNMSGGEYENALRAASLKGHATIVNMLLNNGAHVNAQGGDYGSALQAACGGWGDDEKTLELLLGRGAHVNMPGGYYGNALQAACKKGHENMVKMLLDKGADVNAHGGAYGTALNAACTSFYSGHGTVVELLLDKGADLNITNAKGNSLYIACTNGHEKNARMLLEKGADIDAAIEKARADGAHFTLQMLLDLVPTHH